MKKSKELARSPTKEQTIAILARKRHLLTTSVSIGDCQHCPIREFCAYRNDEADTCRLVDVAMHQFIEIARKSPLIEDIDLHGVRALAALHGALALAEEYLKIYGSTGLNDNGKPYYTGFFKEYLSMQKTYQDQLSLYGLTPKGRQSILGKTSEEESNKGTLYTQYVQTQNRAKKKA